MKRDVMVVATLDGVARSVIIVANPTPRVVWAAATMVAFVSLTPPQKARTTWSCEPLTD